MGNNQTSKDERNRANR